MWDQNVRNAYIVPGERRFWSCGAEFHPTRIGLSLGIAHAKPFIRESFILAAPEANITRRQGQITALSDCPGA